MSNFAIATTSTSNHIADIPSSLAPSMERSSKQGFSTTILSTVDTYKQHIKKITTDNEDTKTAIKQALDSLDNIANKVSEIANKQKKLSHIIQQQHCSQLINKAVKDIEDTHACADGFRISRHTPYTKHAKRQAYMQTIISNTTPANMLKGMVDALRSKER